MSKEKDNNGINIMEIIMGALVQTANDLKAQGVEGLPDVVVVSGDCVSPNKAPVKGSGNGAHQKKNKNMESLKLNSMIIRKLMEERDKDYDKLVELELKFGSDSQEYLSKKAELEKSYEDLEKRLKKLRENPSDSSLAFKDVQLSDRIYRRITSDMLLFENVDSLDEIQYHMFTGNVFELLHARLYYMILSEESKTVEDESMKKELLLKKYMMLQEYPKLEGWFFGKEFMGINNVSESTFQDEEVMKYLLVQPAEYSDIKNAYGYVRILEGIEMRMKAAESAKPIKIKFADCMLLSSLRFTDDEYINEALANAETMAQKAGVSYPKMEITFIADKARESRKSGDNDQ